MVRAGASHSPRLIEVLRQSTQQAVSNIHTSMPGRIETYDAATQTASVKPLSVSTSIDVDGNITAEEYPVLVSVPVIFPRAGGYYTTYPVAVGDFVLLLFCERSIDEYVSGPGEATEPWDVRMHDLSDAVAIPGFYPAQLAIPEVNTEGMELGQEGGAKITIKPQGVIEITFESGNTLTLNGSGAQTTMTVGDGTKHVPIVETLQQLYESMKTAIELWGDLSTGHTHASGVGPTGPPTPALSVPAWDPSINSTKVSIPDG